MRLKDNVRKFVQRQSWGSTPYVRRMSLIWLPVLPLCFLIAAGWLVWQRLSPSAPPRMWVSMVMPLSIFLPQGVAMFFGIRAAKGLKAAFARANGRLCTNCIHDLSGLGDAGKCPECGREFDLKKDAAAWRVAGLGK